MRAVPISSHPDIYKLFKKNTEKSIKLPPVLLECNMELDSNYSKPKNIQYSMINPLY